MNEPLYDDRLDVETRISGREVLVILKRSMGYIGAAKKLFLWKFFFMCGSLFPMLVAPWPLKILVDHVVLVGVGCKYLISATLFGNGQHTKCGLMDFGPIVDTASGQNNCKLFHAFSFLHVLIHL